MIHFDLDDRHLNEPRDSTLPWFARVLVAQFAFDAFVGVVLLPWFILLLLFWPQREPPEQVVRNQEPMPRFVVMEPLRESPPVRPRERADLSDRDRRAETPEQPRTPENPQPLSRGNTPELVEAPRPEPPRGAEPEQPRPEEPARTPAPSAPVSVPQPEPQRPRLGGPIGEASRNPQRYAQNQTFNNPQGGGNDAATGFQFDSKGADFGPWLRRFVSQVKRNWFVPLSAMNFHGHVVLQFNIHRNGRITDVQIAQPSSIDSFNLAAYNAILGSNPTEPLPTEYPDDKVFFTVTFYYNEQPGS